MSILIRLGARCFRATRLSLFSKPVGTGSSGSLTVEESIEGDVIAIENVKTPKVIGK